MDEPPRPTFLPFAITYAAANVVAALAFVGLRWYYLPLALSEGGYTRAYSLTVPTVGATLFRMAVWVVRDFAFLLPVAWAAALILVRGRPASRRLILYAGVWMGGWLAVFLPWPATFAYYLLPFAFGAAVLGGVVVGDLTRAGRERLAGRATAAVLLAATASLWLVTIANAVVDARVQLAVDRANGDLVEFLATLPSQSQVVLNTAQPNEYLFELPLHLSEIKRRPDIVVKPVVRSVPEGQTSLPGFVATPDVANRPVPTVRLPINEGDSTPCQRDAARAPRRSRRARLPVRAAHALAGARLPPTALPGERDPRSWTPPTARAIGAWCTGEPSRTAGTSTESHVPKLAVARGASR